MPDDASEQEDPSIRPAVTGDAPDIADLLWTIRAGTVPHIPPMVHPRERVGRFVREVLLPLFEVWVADTDGGPGGFMALMAPDQLGHLYIAATHRDRGLGSRFVELAQDRYPEGLQLWTFQSNHAAQRFYERHGFVAVEWTDGNNEEGAPDLRMQWRA